MHTVPNRFHRCRLRSGARPLIGGLCVLVAVLSLFDAAPARAQDSEREAILAVVDRLFDGMRAKDEAMLKSVFAPEGRLGTQDPAQFIANVTGSERHLDEVTFDETVLVDGDLAMAWTPYNIFIDGEFHHCGVDLFVMQRQDGAWRITQLNDTRRTEGCDTQRRF